MENTYKRWHLFKVHFENETKTPNAHIWFNIMGYECQDHVINNPRFIKYRIIASNVSREINISWNFRVFSWKVIFISC